MLYLNDTTTQILVTLLGLGIFPFSAYLYKNRQKQYVVMTLILNDLTSRIDQLKVFELTLMDLIDRSQKEEGFTPCVFNTGGHTDHIDWKTEKWLFHIRYASRILDFHNDRCAIHGIVEFTHSNKFVSLSRDRQLKLYSLLLHESQKTIEKGVALRLLLESHNWGKLR